MRLSKNFENTQNFAKIFIVFDHGFSVKENGEVL